MATTKFYLDLRGKAKDGKGSVLISLYHNGTTAMFPTGIRISPGEWGKQRVVKCTDAETLNARLQNRKSEIDKSIAALSLNDEFQEMTATEIKERLTEKKTKKKSSPLIVDLFDSYLSTSDLKPKTREVYNTTLKKIMAYSGDKLTLQDIDFLWLREFDRHLSTVQSINGRAIYLRALRAICNYGRNIGIDSPYAFQNFQIKQEPTEKRCVPVETLRYFMLCPVDSKQEYYRDYFFLMFYLIGINIKDLFYARRDQYVNGRLEYIRAKTRKKYSIKVEPEAAILLEKYKGSNNHLLEAMDHVMHHESFTKMANKRLKTIGDSNGPIIPDITTYYCRHCWATFAHEAGVPTDTISQALGHSFGLRTTLIYIKPDQNLVDDANRRVINYLTCSG